MIESKTGTLLPVGIIVYCDDIVQRVPYMTEAELLDAVTEAIGRGFDTELMQLWVPNEALANKCFNVMDEHNVPRSHIYCLTPENLAGVLGDYTAIIVPQTCPACV